LETLTMGAIRIMVVDDHPVVREGLRALLGTQPGLEVVAEAGTCVETIEQVRRHDPDVILLDLMLPDASGASVVEALIREWPSLRIIILSSVAAEEDVRTCLQAGAKGYVLKGAPIEEIVCAIRLVSEGRVYVAPRAAERLAESAHQARLTEREQEVLALLVAAKSNKEIAHSLGVGEATVKTHVHRILDKLRVRDRAGAITTAIKKGIVRP
jgi:DNA-binding NarL/FixJ family response regulator